MTEQDLKNFEIIDELVTNHFSLSKEGLDLFKSVLHNKNKKMEYIDEKFHQYLGDDLRAEFSFSENENVDKVKSEIDSGWILFKNVFHDFVNGVVLKYGLDNAITYSNFASNKYKVGKNEVKLVKFMHKWYLEQDEYIRQCLGNRALSRVDGINYTDINDFEKIFKICVEKVGTMKIPDRDLKIKISFNFADWFLVSTAETWHSCLSLESDYESCYWSGLPGLITDPNRMLIYINDGTKKKYKDIIVDKLVTRTWGLLNYKDIVYPVRHYPLQFFKGEKFASFFPFEVSTESLENRNDFFDHGKHVMNDIITNHENDGIYIFQDGTKFEPKDGGIQIVSGYSGYHRPQKYRGKWSIGEDTCYCYSDGLSGLIRRGSNLADCMDQGLTCANCGDHHHEDEMYIGDDDQLYCQECFEELFACCSICGEVMSIDNAMMGTDGDYYCERHFERRFVICEHCGETVRRGDERTLDGETYCESCYDELFVECPICNEVVERRNTTIIASGISVCDDCLEEKYRKCNDCGDYVPTEEINNYHNEFICDRCFTKKIQPELVTVEEGVA